MEIESLVAFFLGMVLLGTGVYIRNRYTAITGIGFTGVGLANQFDVSAIRIVSYISIGITVFFYSLMVAKMLQKHKGIIDPLTGLYSRYFLEEYIKKEIEQSKRFSKKFSILFIDLNDFKLINDNFGHSTGDEILKLIGEKLRSALRDCDIIARWGGDEFAVFLSATGCNELLEIIDRLNNSVEVSYGNVKVTLSIGFACYPEHGNSLEELIKEADISMYRSKNMHKIIKKVI